MIKTHYDRYEQLRKQYRIATSLKNGEGTDDYDIIIVFEGFGYAHKRYKIIKNGPGLSAQDLEIICDKGNLCFGGRVEGSTVYVYTD